MSSRIKELVSSKKIVASSDKDPGGKKITKIQTFPVSFSLGGKKENITINTDGPPQPSKEKEIINKARKLHQQGNIPEATKYYQQIINQGCNDHRVFSNYGAILRSFGKLKEAEISTRKAIQLKPDFADAYLNLGLVLIDVGNLQEAELSLRKAIELKPDWQAYFLYAGCIFTRKAFEVVKNKLLEANLLQLENHQKAYINAALKATDLARNNSKYSTNLDISKGSKSLIDKSTNKLILNRQREDELLTYLYSVKNRELNKTDDARYGKGFCSQDLHFFDDQSPTISKLSDDLKKICKEELGLKEIIICESFFNIFKSGSSAGAKSHYHIGKRDSFFGLAFHKYSLIYYLDIGDQNGEDPGILKLYEPDEEILPTNNMLVIIGAERYHSVSYTGRKDRIVLSANFYGF